MALADKYANAKAESGAVGSLWARRLLQNALARPSKDSNPLPTDVRSALIELVACKGLKERIAEMDGGDYLYGGEYVPPNKEREALLAEYEMRQPLAWERARKAIESPLAQFVHSSAEERGKVYERVIPAAIEAQRAALSSAVPGDRE